MNAAVRNYDGSITAHPQQLVRPKHVEELQSILRDTGRYPGPVRAMGSYHSLTPCASSDATMVDMSGMCRLLAIDSKNMTITAQAGLQWIDAALALRKQNLQFITNVEIGNMTLGAAACCHTKDGLDGVEFAQASSYITKIKWVTPSGTLSEASEENDRATLRMMRSSHGLAGVIYEVTFRVKPLEAIRFTYLPRPVAALTEKEVDDIVTRSPGLLCWTIGRTAVFQTRTHAEKPSPLGSTFAAARRRLWNHSVAHLGRSIDLYVPGAMLRNLGHDLTFRAYRGAYQALHFLGGCAIDNPDKTIDYRNTPASCKYAFSFWAFPRDGWLTALREYLEFEQGHFNKYGFRCNMPLGSYYLRKDTNNILSYSYNGDMFSIDPIHAYSDKAAWDRFLREFNEFSYKRNGIPLLNQSPLVESRHVSRGYGDRWREFSAWVTAVDPAGRMLNPFFAGLLA
jgi:UDP-N-acetylenolpyruvoylglucosamine reductase